MAGSGTYVLHSKESDLETIATGKVRLSPALSAEEGRHYDLAIEEAVRRHSKES